MWYSDQVRTVTVLPCARPWRAPAPTEATEAGSSSEAREEQLEKQPTPSEERVEGSAAEAREEQYAKAFVSSEETPSPSVTERSAVQS